MVWGIEYVSTDGRARAVEEGECKALGCRRVVRGALWWLANDAFAKAGKKRAEGRGAVISLAAFESSGAGVGVGEQGSLGAGKCSGYCVEAPLSAVQQVTYGCRFFLRD